MSSEKTPDNAPNLKITSISNKGVVEVIFFQKLVVVSNLTLIDTSVLRFEIKPGELEPDSPLLNFTWFVTEFTSEKMLVQLKFKHAIHVSSYTVRDTLQLTVLDPK